MVEVKQMSVKAKLLRKMYIGMWRRGAERISVMMAKLPEMLIVYMSEKTRKSGDSLFWVGGNAQENQMGHTCPVAIVHLLP